MLRDSIVPSQRRVIVRGPKSWIVLANAHTSLADTATNEKACAPVVAVVVRASVVPEPWVPRL